MATKKRDATTTEERTLKAAINRYNLVAEELRVAQADYNEAERAFEAVNRKHEHAQQKVADANNALLRSFGCKRWP
jgi:F0F1-type ATP synthase membrane subunit b/b'